jgi:membrane-associated phospholipid phosphatase
MKFLCLLLFLVGYAAAQSAEDRQRPYTSSWVIDGFTMAGSIAVAFSASAIDDELPLPSAAELAGLDRSGVNSFDRFVAGTYRKSHLLPSDLTLFAAFAAPLSLLADNTIREDFATVILMYVEMGILSNFAPSYGKGSVKRYRPFVYNQSVPLNERQDIESVRSFFSGHATRAFAAGVMTAIMYEDYFPESPYRTTVWCATIGLASSSAILRVTSGAHFPTDVIVGAIVGSGIGYFIPYIHRTRNDNLSVHPLFSPAGTGIGLAYRF